MLRLCLKCLINYNINNILWNFDLIDCKLIFIHIIQISRLNIILINNILQILKSLYQLFHRYILDSCCFNQLSFSIYKLRIIWYKMRDSIFVKDIIINKLNIIIINIINILISNDFYQFMYNNISRSIIILYKYYNSMN